MLKITKLSGKKSKKTLINGETYYVHGLEDSAKRSIFPKLVYRFDAIPIKIHKFFYRYGTLYSKIYVEIKCVFMPVRFNAIYVTLEHILTFHFSSERLI